MTTQRAYQIYQGGDWQTYRYSVAQVFDLLDQLRDVTGMALTGGMPAPFIASTALQPADMLHDLCSDLVGALDLALADLAVQAQTHLPSRWSMVEMRALVGQLPQLVQNGQEDLDNLPGIADRAERIRYLLQRLDN